MANQHQLQSTGMEMLLPKSLKFLKMNPSEVNKQFIGETEIVKVALSMLNEIPESLVLFVLNDNEQLVGTLTDGDVRRGLLKGLTLQNTVSDLCSASFRFIRKKEFDLNDMRISAKSSLSLFPCSTIKPGY